MTAYFITGTDTDVGKTLVSAALTLVTRGSYWKPIQSGMRDDVTVKGLTGLSDTHFLPANYTLHAALSPDQAAAQEGVVIDVSTCVLPTTESLLIVEGAGGVFTPLTSSLSMIDLMQQLALPIIVVARGTLGTINHTLLTLEALRQRRLTIHGVVFSGQLDVANQRAIEQRGHVRTLFHIPFFADVSASAFQQWVTETEQRLQEALL